MHPCRRGIKTFAEVEGVAVIDTDDTGVDGAGDEIGSRSGQGQGQDQDNEKVLAHRGMAC